MEKSRPSQRHSSISLLHVTSSNLYKDRSVTVSGGLENHRSSHQYAQSSAWDQNSKVLHDNSNSSNFVNHGDQKQTSICFKKDITCKSIMWKHFLCTSHMKHCNVHDNVCLLYNLQVVDSSLCDGWSNTMSIPKSIISLIMQTNTWFTSQNITLQTRSLVLIIIHGKHMLTFRFVWSNC